LIYSDQELLGIHALVEDVVVPVVVIVGRRLGLGRPAAAVLVIAAAPLAQASVGIVAIEVDKGAEAACALCLGLLRILPGPGKGELKVPG
jgi:hypothetical protein